MSKYINCPDKNIRIKLNQLDFQYYQHKNFDQNSTFDSKKCWNLQISQKTIYLKKCFIDQSLGKVMKFEECNVNCSENINHNHG